MPRNKSRTTVHVQLDAELLERVDILAKQQDRTRSGQIRWLMLRALRRYTEARRRQHAAASDAQGAPA